MVRPIVNTSQKQAITILVIGIAYWKLTEYFQWAIPCPIRWLTNVPCPGCGMGRACSALAHGYFHHAWQLHFGSYILASYLVLALLPSPIQQYFNKKTPKSFRRALGITIIIVLIMRWLLVISGQVEV